MNRTPWIRMLVAGIIVVGLLSPSTVANPIMQGGSTAPHLVIGDLAILRVPSHDISWVGEPISDGPFNVQFTVTDSNGALFAAVRLQASSVPVAKVVDMHVRDADVQMTIVPEVKASGSCANGVHNYNVCSDLFYSGGANPIWMQGSATGMSSSYYCYNCMLIEGCQEAGFTSCPKSIRFTVQGSESYASVCWAWGMWRKVFSKTTFDGVGPESGNVWVSQTTSC